MATFEAGAIILAATHEELVDAWDTFDTFAWTASTNPAIGNGTKKGRYKFIGDWVIYDFGLLMGSTTTFGSSQWFIELPVTADMAGSPLNDLYIGGWHGWDNAPTPAHRGGRVQLATATTLTLHTAADPVAGVTATAPITWATSDRCSGRAVYRAA